MHSSNNSRRRSSRHSSRQQAHQQQQPAAAASRACVRDVQLLMVVMVLVGEFVLVQHVRAAAGIVRVVCKRRKIVLAVSMFSC